MNDALKIVIGRTSATDREPSTAEQFYFWIAPGQKINLFDYVAVGYGDGKKKCGEVVELRYFTDAASHLANFLSNNHGSTDEEPNTNRIGVTLAKVEIIGDIPPDDAEKYIAFDMPLENEKDVRFCDPKDIMKAFGMYDIPEKDRITAGLIQTSYGAEAIVYLNRQYLLGPQAAHLNITGISGMATKTSYAMFLIQSILQKNESNDTAVVIFNVKGGDLLKIHEASEQLSDEDKELWEKLGINPDPFEDVTYFLPRGKDGKPNSFEIPKDCNTFAYELEDSRHDLDLLFSNIDDSSNTMDSLIGIINEGIDDRQQNTAWANVVDWSSLIDGEPLSDVEGESQKVESIRSTSVTKFRRHMKRMVQTNTTGVFVDKRNKNDLNLPEQLKEIEGGNTYVIDIAKLAEHEQSFAFGSSLRSIYYAMDSGGDNLPKKVIIFVDELNKYAPARGIGSDVLLRKLMDITERGRGLGIILISAEQFMSFVHDRVIGNMSTKIVGRTTLNEAKCPEYSFLENDLKGSATRLSKGEMIIQHAVFRQPIKIIFPKPAFKQDE